MTNNFIKGKQCFSLQLNDKIKLIIYLSKNYEEEYFDSALYFYNGKKEYLLIVDSFAFTIGKSLYTRLYNLNAYQGNRFVDELNNSASREFYEKFGKYYEFCECENYDMYLYKQEEKIIFLLNKIETKNIDGNEFFSIKHKKFYEAEISVEKLLQWKNILDKEFIPRYISELKTISKNIKDTQIEASLAALKKGLL